MIVVEGPDGAGKTTLIKELCERTGLEVAPRVVSKDAEAMTDLVEWTERNVDRGFHLNIYDRHRLISEPIYGPIIRGTLEPGFDDPNWFYTMLHQFYLNDPVIVYCLPPLQVVWNNVKDDRDNDVVNQGDTIKKIWMAYMNKAYTEHLLRPSPETFVYDYTETTFSSALVNLICQHIDKRIAAHV